MTLPLVIAIDGPSASGKSTLGERVARRLDYLFFDTGLMYRAVALAGLKRLGGIGDERAVSGLAETIQIDVRQPTVADRRICDVLLDEVDVTWDIRTPEVDAAVSPVSAYPDVRTAMTNQQRRIADRGRVVMVGRDIGTVVCPQAGLKIYLEASVEERARRRYREKIERGEAASLEAITANLRERDRIDSTRSVAPLKPAADAVVIDSDGMTIDEVVEKVMGLVERQV